MELIFTLIIGVGYFLFNFLKLVVDVRVRYRGELNFLYWVVCLFFGVWLEVVDYIRFLLKSSME